MPYSIAPRVPYLLAQRPIPNIMNPVARLLWTQKGRYIPPEGPSGQQTIKKQAKNLVKTGFPAHKNAL